MRGPIIRLAMTAAAAAALAGCTTYGYDGVSTRVSVGYGSGYGGYYGDPYSRNPYYGWYDGYYYPGAGYYVYDRYGSRHRWSDRHRQHWERYRRHDARANWSGYGYRQRGDAENRTIRRGDRQRWSPPAREIRRDRRSGAAPGVVASPPPRTVQQQPAVRSERRAQTRPATRARVEERRTRGGARESRRNERPE